MKSLLFELVRYYYRLIFSSTLVPRLGIDSRFVSLSDPYVVTSDEVLNVSESFSSSEVFVLESNFDVRALVSVSVFGSDKIWYSFCVGF